MTAIGWNTTDRKSELVFTAENIRLIIIKTAAFLNDEFVSNAKKFITPVSAKIENAITDPTIEPNPAQSDLR